MSFPAYPAYKDSDVEWLGKVPEHWRAGHLRWLSNRYSGGTPDKSKLEYWEEGTIPWLNSGAVNDRLITEASTYITNEAFANSSAKWIPKGALVMALAGQGKTKGMVAQLGIASTCNQSMAAIIPTGEIDARFLFWWLDANYQNIRNMAGGDMRDGLNLELLGDIQCPLPTTGEQIEISILLDHETAKIDALLNEQGCLVEVLEEKKRAIIHDVVTNGVNPSVPMKKSGLSWWGDIPEHWSVRRVKTVSTFTTSGPRGWSDRIGDQGSIFVQSGDLNDLLGVDFSTAKRVSVQDDAEASRTRLVDGDVVVCITGAKTGNVAICSVVPEDAYINQHLCLIRPGSDITPEFLGASLKSGFGQDQLEVSQYGLKQGLSLDGVRETVVLLPPIEEQREICQFLEVEVGRILRLISLAKDAIRLLAERRTTLIGAAVTGKIDVRGLA